MRTREFPKLGFGGSFGELLAGGGGYGEFGSGPGFGEFGSQPVAPTKTAVESIIQTVPKTMTTTSSTLVWSGVVTTAGNRIMVIFGIRSSTVAPVSVTDSAGNTYTQLAAVTSTSTASIYVYATSAASPLAITAGNGGTITVTVGSAISLVGRFWEVHGLSNTAVLDKLVSSNSAGVTATAIATPTQGPLSENAELTFGAVVNDYGSGVRTYSGQAFTSGTPTTSWSSAVAGDNSTVTGAVGVQMHSGVISEPSNENGEHYVDTLSSASQYAAIAFSLVGA